MKSTHIQFSVLAGVCAALVSGANAVRAGTLDFGPRALPEKSARLEDEGPPDAKFKIWWTAVKDNKNIDSAVPAYEGTGNRPNAPNGNRIASVPIPKDSNFRNGHGNDTETLPVTDFHQTVTSATYRGTDEGATSVLGGAAYRFLAPDHMRMTFIADAVYEMVGDDVRMSIPDGFGDSNLDGVIGGGDTIYSLVNLYDYLPAMNSWEFGQTFEVVNGVCDDLPGMGFGTAPMVFDVDALPFGTGRTVVSGMDNPEPYTGLIRIDAAHTVVVPSPGTLALISLAGGLVLRRRR